VPIRRRALIVVDLQNDFCSGGALAVPGGDRIVPVINELIDRFTAHGRPVFFTRDWHPANHCSFRERGGAWPPHCVKETDGAAFNSELRRPGGRIVISKAGDPDRDAYSGFDGTELGARLRDSEITSIVVCGLATDYCVRATAIDGRREGFEVVVVEDAIRGVETEPGDSARAIEEMRRAGAHISSARAITP